MKVVVKVRGAGRKMIRSGPPKGKKGRRSVVYRASGCTPFEKGPAMACGFAILVAVVLAYHNLQGTRTICVAVRPAPSTNWQFSSPGRSFQIPESGSPPHIQPDI